MGNSAAQRDISGMGKANQVAAVVMLDGGVGMSTFAICLILAAMLGGAVAVRSLVAWGLAVFGFLAILVSFLLFGWAAVMGVAALLGLGLALHFVQEAQTRAELKELRERARRRDGW